MSKLTEIHEYLLSKGITEDELVKYDASSVLTSLAIMRYAHRNQFRVNGVEYGRHPFGVFQKYRDLVSVSDDGYALDQMRKRGIPFEGVQEVALLHDVIEDTDFTMEDIEEVFKECGNYEFFKIWIQYPLSLITHNPKESYDVYCEKCCQSPISALVKMIDMVDNLNPLSLDKFGEKEFLRSVRYLKCIKKINDRFHFIENIIDYHEDYKKVFNEIISKQPNIN